MSPPHHRDQAVEAYARQFAELTTVLDDLLDEADRVSDERAVLALRMYEATGLTMQRLGATLGLSGPRIQQLVARGRLIDGQAR